MFGIAFMKAAPTTYVLHYRDGKVVREGRGLSFFYYAPTATIVAVPIGSIDVPFVFNEVTSDFQEVSIQGQLTYRVTNAQQLATGPGSTGWLSSVFNMAAGITSVLPGAKPTPSPAI